MSEDINQKVQDEAEGLIESEKTLTAEVNTLETELRELDPKFQLFIEKQAELRLVQTKNQKAWDQIKDAMIEYNIKTIKGDWGSVTVVERTNYKADLDEVPAKFIKKVIDTTKIAASHKLEGKLPKGVTTTTTKFLMKKFKKGDE